MDKPNRDILGEWRESARFWRKRSGLVRSMFQPITTALVEQARVDRGDRVLDVAGGSGEPSLSLAEIVRNEGIVVYSDAVLEMATTARQTARQREIRNLLFTLARGESLPFLPHIFDGVVCRLGIMLFSDPGSAARELMRVVKPKRDVVCAVWGDKENNPFFHIITDIMSRHVVSPPEDPEAPGAFRFAERGKLAHLFAESGAGETTESALRFNIEADLTPEEFWELRVDLSDTLRSKVANLTPQQIEQISHEVKESSRPFFRGDRMSFPAEVLLVRAKKA